MMAATARTIVVVVHDVLSLSCVNGVRWVLSPGKEPHELDDGRAQGDDVHRGKQTEDERKDELDAELRGALLGPLTALRSAHLRLRAKSLRDARPEPIRLHQHRHELAHVIDLGALGEVLERLQSRLAGANLGRDG